MRSFMSRIREKRPNRLFEIGKTKIFQETLSMKSSPLHFRFGAVRVASPESGSGMRYDHGSDGLLIDPNRQIFTVTDGISRCDGKGHEYLSVLQKSL